MNFLFDLKYMVKGSSVEGLLTNLGELTVPVNAVEEPVKTESN